MMESEAVSTSWSDLYFVSAPSARIGVQRITSPSQAATSSGSSVALV
jgi:hypothetical protein